MAYRQFRDVTLPIEGQEGEVYLSYDRWVENPLFAFDITPDGSAATGEFYKTPPRSGDISLEMRRTDAMADQTIDAIIYLEYNNQIDLRVIDGSVLVDW